MLILVAVAACSDNPKPAVDAPPQADAAIDAPWLNEGRRARPAWLEPPADWKWSREEYFADPAAIADEVYHIAHQHPSTWSFDHIIRPFAEKW